jgi:hypothetical protein
MSSFRRVLLTKLTVQAKPMEMQTNMSKNVTAVQLYYAQNVQGSCLNVPQYWAVKIAKSA